MKDLRKGESLWFIWDGSPKEDVSPDSLIFYTEEHINIEEEVVKRALASSLQREGLVPSLGAGFSIIDSSTNGHGYMNVGVDFLVFCDEDGLTTNGDVVSEIVPITWVEIKEVD
jgi:hypothetical protein